MNIRDPRFTHRAQYALLWSFVVGLAVYAALNVTLIAPLAGFCRFISGSLPAPLEFSWDALPACAAMVAWQIILVIPLMAIVHRLAGHGRLHKASADLKLTRFRARTAAVIVSLPLVMLACAGSSGCAALTEELVFRGLPLGAWRHYDGHPMTWLFYAVAIFANLVFAWVHLDNYQDAPDRRWYRVLPQFIGGLWDTYFFMLYGIVGAVVGHFLYDFVIMFSRYPLKLAEVWPEAPSD